MHYGVYSSTVCPIKEKSEPVEKGEGCGSLRKEHELRTLAGTWGFPVLPGSLRKLAFTLSISFLIFGVTDH